MHNENQSEQLLKLADVFQFLAGVMLPVVMGVVIATAKIVINTPNKSHSIVDIIFSIVSAPTCLLFIATTAFFTALALATRHFAAKYNIYRPAHENGKNNGVW